MIRLNVYFLVLYDCLVLFVLMLRLTFGYPDREQSASNRRAVGRVSGQSVRSPRESAELGRSRPGAAGRLQSTSAQSAGEQSTDASCVESGTLVYPGVF